MTQNENVLVHVRPRLTPVKGTLGLVFALLSVFCILVVFFQKITTSFQEVRGIPVKLPKSAGELTYTEKDLIVTVDGKTGIYLADSIIANDEKMKDTLKRRITEVSTGNQNTQGTKRLILRAGADVSLATITTIMSIAKELDMDVFLMTENEAPKDRVEIREKE